MTSYTVTAPDNMSYVNAAYALMKISSAQDEETCQANDIVELFKKAVLNHPTIIKGFLSNIFARNWNYFSRNSGIKSDQPIILQLSYGTFFTADFKDFPLITIDQLRQDGSKNVSFQKKLNTYNKTKSENRLDQNDQHQFSDLLKERRQKNLYHLDLIAATALGALGLGWWLINR